MSFAADIIRSLPGSQVGEPCSDEEIASAEKTLKSPFPEWLRQMYRGCNGFVTSLGEDFLFTLDELVSHNEFLRGEDYFPKFLQRAVIYGHDGGGMYWGVILDQSQQVLEWDPEWGEECDLKSVTPLQAWNARNSLGQGE